MKQNKFKILFEISKATLTVLFIVLKVTKQITWSWIWVVSPYWISFVITTLFVLLLCVIFLFVKLVKLCMKGKKKNEVAKI